MDPGEVAKRLALRDTSDPRLERVVAAACDAIDDWTANGWTETDVIPAAVTEVALGLSVDLWKQPDATLGVIGDTTYGPIRIGTQLRKRYMPLLYQWGLTGQWGVA